ncbi:MAG TPA: helix-hairpin-helix domain-containing protein [Nitrospirales bacterium]|nr:helix-hairpin-helix domain-containing protein [Nitrospirales bacterium]
MDKYQVANMLDEIGLLLEMKGEHPFKCRAYGKAAQSIRNLQQDLGELVASGRIKAIPGIGTTLASQLAELVGTGHLAFHDALRASIPPGLIEMAEVPGLGPKKCLTIWEKLGISTVGELEYACVENRLVGLPGFGKKTQEKIERGIQQLKQREGLFLYATVVGEAGRLTRALRETPTIRRAELVGDLRRSCEVVSRIALLAAANAAEVARAFRELDGVEDVAIDGAGAVTARSHLGIPIYVRVVNAITPHLILAETAHADHLALLAARAAQRGVPWNLSGPEFAPMAEHEADLYAALGLPYLEPELCEGLDELAMADEGRLKPLVDPGTLQGLFHLHTTDSDGAATLEEMVDAARARGYRYVGISDHSQSAFYANGLKEDRIRAQHAAIDALRERVAGIRILKGIESDILPDGSLDYPDEVLARFDFVIGSVHGRFNLPEPEQTERVVRALGHPCLTILGHPTGRLLLSRKGYSLDMPRVLAAAREHGKVIEINANPHRLELDWRHVREARRLGIQMTINPDAHSVRGLEDIVYGVNVARKGGVSADDLLNALPADRLDAALHATRR